MSAEFVRVLPEHDSSTFSALVLTGCSSHVGRLKNMFFAIKIDPRKTFTSQTQPLSRNYCETSQQGIYVAAGSITFRQDLL